MVFQELLKRFAPAASEPLAKVGIKAGVYPYLVQKGGETTRFHLRVDRDGNGVLLANATAAAQLRPSGVIIARGLLEGLDREEIVSQLSASFREVQPAAAEQDVESVHRVIGALSAPGDNYPILNLPDPSFAPEATLLEKPLSADVPLTEPDRLRPILQRLWDLGIPHVTLVAGENPSPADLVRAVERAEDLGMIAGVRARGSDLVQGTLIKDLALAGVDHVDILYLSAESKVHDSLAGEGDHQRALEAFMQTCQNEVCPMAVMALVASTLHTLEETLADLVGRGVRNVGFYAIGTTEPEPPEAVKAEAMAQVAQAVEESAAEADVRFLWYPPVRYAPAVSLAEQVRRGPRTAGDNSIRVESDGSVIPARGPLRSAGNLLTGDWDTISTHEVYRNYRQRLGANTHCDACPGLAICAADCPRNPAGWAESSGQWAVDSGQ